MAKHYFTFGFGQPYENCFHVIEADSGVEAKHEMVKRFENRWSMQYTEEEWIIKGVTQETFFNLKEVK